MAFLLDFVGLVKGSHDCPAFSCYLVCDMSTLPSVLANMFVIEEKESMMGVHCLFFVGPRLGDQLMPIKACPDRMCHEFPQEDVSESRPVHAHFKEQVQQLAGASEDFKREGVSFLRALLQPDPAKRLTARQALEHPFITNAFNSVDPAAMPPKIEKPVMVDTTFRREWREVFNQRRKMEVEEDGGGGSGCVCDVTPVRHMSVNIGGPSAPSVVSCVSRSDC
jgi:serine/threonine protein kinase